MFFIDDLVLRSIGISLPGIDMIWTLEQIQKYAYKNLYNTEKIKNQIKETRLLYEFKELSRQEYDSRNTELMRKLELAEKYNDMNLVSKMDLLG
jgi:hypothetical protein